MVVITFEGMDEECDVDLSTSYMLSVSRVAESCIGKKISKNNFTLPSWMIKKRKSSWDSILSKYCIAEDDDSCEVAFEVQCNTEIRKEFVGAECVSHCETKQNECRLTLRPNLRKRKLKDLDAMVADYNWENEEPNSDKSKVSLHDQQATALHYDDGSAKERGESFQENFMADILSGSLKCRRRLGNNSSKQPEDVKDDADNNESKRSHSCSASSKIETVKQLTNACEENRTSKSLAVSVFGKGCSNTEETENILLVDVNEKKVTVEVPAAGREVSIGLKQNVPLDNTVVSEQLDKCEGKGSCGKGMVKYHSSGEENIKVPVKETKSLPLVSHKKSVNDVRSIATSSMKRTTRSCAFKCVSHVTKPNVTFTEIDLVGVSEMDFDSLPLSVWRTVQTKLKLWTPEVVTQKCNSVVSTSRKNTCMSLNKDVSEKNLIKDSEDKVVSLNSSEHDDCNLVCAHESISSSEEKSGNAVVRETSVSNNQPIHHEPIHTLKNCWVVLDRLKDCVKKCDESLENEVREPWKEVDIPVCRDKQSVVNNVSEGENITYSIDCVEPNQAEDVKSGTKLMAADSRHLQQSLKWSLGPCAEGAKVENYESKNIERNSVKPYYTASSSEEAREVNVVDATKPEKKLMLQTSKVAFPKYEGKPAMHCQNASKVSDSTVNASLGSDRKTYSCSRDNKNVSFQVNQKNVLIRENTPVLSDVIAVGDVSDILVSSALNSSKGVKITGTKKENKPLFPPTVTSKFVNHVKCVSSNNVKPKILTSTDHLVLGKYSCSEFSNRNIANSRRMEVKQCGKLVDYSNSSQNLKVDLLYKERGSTLGSYYQQSSLYKSVNKVYEKHVSFRSRHNKENVQHQARGNIRSPLYDAEYNPSGSKQPTKDLKCFINRVELRNANLEDYQAQGKIKITKRKPFRMKVVSSDKDDRVITLDFNE